MKEIWKDVPNYEGLYQVSNYGRVRSLERVVTTKSGWTFRVNGRILKPTVKKRGYMDIILCKNSKKKHYYVHRLVAIAFLDGDVKEEVNHIDMNPSNNNLDNLEWVTSSENKKHRFENKSQIGTLVLDIQMGIYYDNIKEASDALNIKCTKLTDWLNPNRHGTNITNIIKV